MSYSTDLIHLSAVLLCEVLGLGYEYNMPDLLLIISCYCPTIQWIRLYDNHGEEEDDDADDDASFFICYIVNKTVSASSVSLISTPPLLLSACLHARLVDPHASVIVQ